MYLNTAKLRWGLARLRSGRSPDLREVASREWELCSAETIKIPPALHSDDMIQRIVRLSPWRDRATEELLVSGGQLEHGASRAHLIENVRLEGSFLYRGAAKLAQGCYKESFFSPQSEKINRIEEASLVTSWGGSRFFGNFMLEDFPLSMLPRADKTPISMTSRLYPHAAGYRSLCVLPTPRFVQRARIRHLTLYTDYAQNSSKESRYRELRARIRRALWSASTAPGVYLKRGATGERRMIANEPEIEKFLVGLGFDIVEPATLAARDVALRTLDTQVVISVEGSHLSHIIYTLAEGGMLLVLQPPDRFAMAYKEFTDRMNMRFAFIVGTPDQNGFRIDPVEIEHILNRWSQTAEVL